MTPLDDKLAEIARTPVLLVASDYDGTLAPIVDDPSAARPRRESKVALEVLSRMPQTHVAVISGRALRDLDALLGAPGAVRLVGSHGSEFDLGFASSLSAGQVELLARVDAAIAAIADSQEGFTVERKPASVTFHYRRASESAAKRALSKIRRGPAKLRGVHVRDGHKVIELAVVPTSKGGALERIRHAVGATAALFVGDDLTDEDAFTSLAGPDVGVKVGPGRTAAGFRVDDTEAVARLLARLTELRAEWLAGAGAVPIEHHAMISDLRTAALIEPAGRVVWLPAPRIDSPAVFAGIIGGDSAGFFSIEPAGAGVVKGQDYVKGTMIVRTRWQGVTLTDYLDCSEGRPFQRAGRTDLVRVVEGRGRVVMRLVPRPDFGRASVAIREREEGLEIDGGADPIVLRAPGVRWRIEGQGPQEAIAEVELSGEPLVVELRLGTGSVRAAAMAEPQRRAQTAAFWSGWLASLTLPAVQRDMVARSALALRALIHGPTGAIAAAATTSLPEHVGGVRNWDYRYCWPRDAAMAASSLARLGSTGPALRLLDWLQGVVEEEGSARRLRPLYTVSGRELGPEGQIGELCGYRESRPVRVGNAAAQQVQLDVYGPIVDVVATLAELGAPVTPEHWRLVEAMVDAVGARWEEPDHGIWEARRPRAHHVHTKLMCWHAVDRALRIADVYAGREPAGWCELRARIGEDVVANGWNGDRGSFTATYGSPHIEAGVLWVVLAGLLPPGDARVARTIEAVERELRDGPTVYRYREDDGLPGREGGFAICAAWLCRAYAAVGRVDDAEGLLGDIAATAGPTGLLAEQYDPEHRTALGNYPQAYSHLGVIDAALAIEHARRR